MPEVKFEPRDSLVSQKEQEEPQGKRLTKRFRKSTASNADQKSQTQKGCFRRLCEAIFCCFGSKTKAHSDYTAIKDVL